MIGIKDDRGYNQGYKNTAAMKIRTERRADYIISLMDSNENKNVLEIGCGRGEIAYLIASKTKNFVYGTDICDPFIDEAKTKYTLPNLNFDILDFNEPGEFSEKKFDYIIGNGILHHLYHNIENALKRFQTLLNPDGKIIFLEPNLYNPYCYLIFNTTKFFRDWAKLEPTEKAFSKRFINKKLENAGFVNIKIEYKDFLLPIVPPFLIKPVIWGGNLFEKTPLIKTISQSLFISAAKGY